MIKTPSTKPVLRRFLVALLGVAGLFGLETQAQVVTQNTPFVPRLARDIQEAEPIDMMRCKPDYPRASRLNEEQGAVMVAITVDANGDTSNLRIVRSSGFKNLDRATFNVLLDCPFRPTVIGGKAYRSDRGIIYVWKLQD